MITIKNLQNVISNIFFGDADGLKHIVSIHDNYFVPMIKKGDNNATWIGCLILSHGADTGIDKIENANKLTTSFRLCFMGPDAEEMAISTLLWNERSDVKHSFEAIDADIENMRCRVYTKIIEQEGIDNVLLWVTDLQAVSFLKIPTNQKTWVIHSITTESNKETK